MTVWDDESRYQALGGFFGRPPSFPLAALLLALAADVALPPRLPRATAARFLAIRCGSTAGEPLPCQPLRFPVPASPSQNWRQLIEHGLSQCLWSPIGSCVPARQARLVLRASVDVPLFLLGLPAWCDSCGIQCGPRCAVQDDHRQTNDDGQRDPDYSRPRTLRSDGHDNLRAVGWPDATRSSSILVNVRSLRVSITHAEYVYSSPHCLQMATRTVFCFPAITGSGALHDGHSAVIFMNRRINLTD